MLNFFEKYRKYAFYAYFLLCAVFCIVRFAVPVETTVGKGLEDLGRRQTARVYVFPDENVWENPEKIRIFKESGKYVEFAEKARKIDRKITELNIKNKRRR